MGICSSVLFDHLKSDICHSRIGLEMELGEPRSLNSIPVELSPRAVAGYRILESFLKKFSDDPSGPADEAALALFLHWNNRCKDWVEPQAKNEVESLVLGELRSKFQICFERPWGAVIDFSQETAAFIRPGPGASVDASGTDFYQKTVAGPMSATSADLHTHYVETQCLPFDLEASAELTRASVFESTVVSGSSLGFAPKNREISRTTCTEPNVNMLYQLATGRVLEETLREVFNIDITCQGDLNKELARRGSLNGTLGTMDLTSASDCKAVKLFNWLMPYREVRYWFNWIRSPETKLPKKFHRKYGKSVELHMLSSMGNGFTFPLMTLLFCCVVYAAYKVLGIPIVYNRRVYDAHGALLKTVPGNFGVFGDDIIVVSEAFDLVGRTLELLGYSVNLSKSFNKGGFRESCGGDYYFGHNVRGVYCKSLKQPQHRYALINRLNAWSSEWDVPLCNTIQYLMTSVWFIPVPPYEGASCGVIVPFELAAGLKLHPEPKNRRRPWYTGSVVYSRFLPSPSLWDPALGLPYQQELDVTDPRRPVRVAKPGSDPFVNASGVVLAAVRGYIRNGLITIREDNVRYKKRVAVCPGWVFDGTSQAGFSPEGWRRFERYVARVNLNR